MPYVDMTTTDQVISDVVFLLFICIFLAWVFTALFASAKAFGAFLKN